MKEVLANRVIFRKINLSKTRNFYKICTFLLVVLYKNVTLKSMYDAIKPGHENGLSDGESSSSSGKPIFFSTSSFSAQHQMYFSNLPTISQHRITTFFVFPISQSAASSPYGAKRGASAFEIICPLAFRFRQVQMDYLY